ncbi:MULTISPECIES: queuosine precursor transporter [Metabacillus]|uniref:Probable queuosine precursor transporter n=1 Tax=Metabacillus indicus TaxID=246786 RepID=A0A084H054_METID|nr:MULTISPECIES: queuosine precursor transporter [Metabacillus]KEZ50641.1 membrane protein [Metabacillus indicus LMG 22858]KEZ52966.1 membrane protein [Metabacillus indicus]
MPNELLWIGFAFINFIIVLLFYKLFGKSGLFVWIGFSTVVANLQVVKTIEIFGLTATMGNIMYGTAFLVTDIINEKYGEKEAKKAVWLGFATLISLTVIMQGVLMFQPDETDFAQGALKTIFDMIPRIAIGSLAAFIISQYTDVAIYSWLRRKFPSDRLLWVRNNGSTMISQLLDTLIFTSIAFLGVYPFDIWIQIFITTYLIKFVVAIIDTPFAYLAKRIKPAE